MFPSCAGGNCNAWGIGKDGSYIRGAVTSGDTIPQRCKDEIEDLFVRAAAARGVRGGA